MSKALLTVTSLVCAGVLAIAAPASASATTNFSATFQLHYRHGVAPVPCSVDFCFSGIVAGYGEATLSGTVTSSSPILGTSCASATYEATIELAESSTLALEASGVVCPVGNSGNAPGSPVSYGNPISLTGTFTIPGGTGVFAGASGSGTFIDYFAGDVQVANLSGTIS
jgi:hypothetical protein